MQTAGEPVALSDATAAAPSFTAPIEAQVLTFELTVSDGEADSAPATASVGVANHAPVADAGADQLLEGGEVVTLDGSGSFDVDNDDLTFEWTQTAGPTVELSDYTAAEPTFEAPLAKATLEFELRVDDGLANSDPDTVTITIPNHAPVADAGADQNVAGGAQVTLTGAGSDQDDDPLTWQWTQVAGQGVLLSDATSATPTFEAPAEKGELVFQLIVDDGELESAAATTSVHVANNPPVANAGPDQTIDGGSLVSLDGSGSSDLDGDALSFAWTQTGGTTVTLSDPTAVKPTFLAPVPKGELTFDLTVSDGSESSAADAVTITIPNHAPTADAGADVTVDGGSQVTLSGTASDLDEDALAWTWTQTAGPTVQLSDATSQSPSFTAPVAHATLVFELVVSDGELSSEADSVTVTVPNKAPVADAGADQAVDGGTVVTLNGSGTDEDGDPLTYQWTQLSGAGVLLSDATAPSPTFTAPATKDALVFRLTVDDGDITSAPSDVTITINNNAPTANADDDQSVEGGSLVTLDGSNSSDLDGDALAFAWTQTSGPTVQLSDPTATKPTFLAPVPRATITFDLVVNDGTDNSAADSVTVSVANHAPVTNAGADQTITGGSVVTLSGTASDMDSDPMTYQWTQTSGPTVALADATALETTFTAPVPKGTLTFELTANDGIEVGPADAVTITIANHAPVVDAGLDQTVAGDATVQLSGSASDLDGDAVTYQWTQVSGAPADRRSDGGEPDVQGPAAEGRAGLQPGRRRRRGDGRAGYGLGVRAEQRADLRSRPRPERRR